MNRWRAMVIRAAFCFAIVTSSAWGDLAEDMVAGIDRYLDAANAQARDARETNWKRDLSSSAAYEASVEPHRARLAHILGVVDERLAPAMEVVGPVKENTPVATGPGYEVYEVRWPVLEGVTAEGLLLEPDGTAIANVVALADCDDAPEMLVGLEPGIPPSSQFARLLAERRCRVLVPVLIDRADTYSGNPEISMTNQPHREYLYRPAYQMGRHIIGYEVQKILAGLDWFAKTSESSCGVAGYGEGALLAFYAAALDRRIDAALVSGYFGPREELWSEPIYRNVWGLLERFGDAEVATLIAPRTLIVETADAPRVEGPPAPDSGRSGGAPGRIQTPSVESVVHELERARRLVDGLQPTPRFVMTHPANGLAGDAASLDAFVTALAPGATETEASEHRALLRQRASTDPNARLKRQFDELLEHTQKLMRESPKRRAEFWAKADTSSSDVFQASVEWYRDYFWEEIIGRFPEPDPMAEPKIRPRYETPEFNGFEVVLDVYPDVFAYGILLVPKDLGEGERRPVVVCQHGLEGRPEEVTEPGSDSHYYHAYGCRLAERGFIVFAPQNPYIGGDSFRMLQRKANPLGKSLFGIITRQHQRILEWLGSLPYVDRNRMAFYGLSYGGKTAMRVPVLLKDYCLAICSGDFNEWVWKTVSNDSPYSYQFTHEYEMYEFGLGETFNYAELSGLIFPRPFMVERGHHDGVAPDEWVAYEYAKARRRYALFGMAENTTIEYFVGPHEIHGVGTFEFLHRHLNFPPRQ